MGIHPEKVTALEQIPFLPIEFFKSHQVMTGNFKSKVVFSSSGTTGSVTSAHFVKDQMLYEKSFSKAFELFYGPMSNYRILALLPSYLEREGSSLVYMVDRLMKTSGHPENGFYLNDLKALRTSLISLERANKKTLLIGVSFALLDFAEHFGLPLRNTTIMETGGMKGKRKEIVRSELHEILQKAFSIKNVHSEYGMTELLSQGYSQGNGLFRPPPWMKVLTRDTEDPLHTQKPGQTGGLNIIDLANVHSCSFIATQDLGKVHADGSFEVLGRFDHADVRGCNLMAV